jgi:protein-S-isoprenylcysteine O-methyltransferase
LTLLLGIVALAGGLDVLEARRQRRLGADPWLDRDPGASRLMARTCLPAAIYAVAAAVLTPSLALPRAVRHGAFLGGLTMAAAGIGLRQWAIRTLGRLFVGYVTVQPGHHVVRGGPYRYLRHPSYTGIWLLVAGLGLATANVLGVAIAALLPLVGLVSRIEAEEAALSRALPDDYPAYAARTSRLVPLVWIALIGGGGFSRLRPVPPVRAGRRRR